MSKEKKLKTLIGEVIKISGTNTAKVRVESKYPHQRYEKIVKHHTNYVVHYNSDLKVEVGSKVSFAQCAPVSKLKKWAVVEVF